MKISPKPFLLLIAGVALWGCKKDSPDEKQPSLKYKETIINFPGMGSSYSTVNGGNTTIWTEVALNNFDITSYAADSISFSAYLHGSDATVKASVELFDLTNFRSVNNTIISTYATSPSLQTTTVNFLKNLPTGPITLNCRIITDKAGIDAVYSNPTIKIYKKED